MHHLETKIDQLDMWSVYEPAGMIVDIGAGLHCFRSAMDRLARQA